MVLRDNRWNDKNSLSMLFNLLYLLDPVFGNPIGSDDLLIDVDVHVEVDVTDSSSC